MPTKIQWCDETYNPVTGCSPVSIGCTNCYAKKMANRLAGRAGYDKDDPFKITFHPGRTHIPTRWKKPRRIFMCSMGDLFHKDVPDHWIDLIIQLIPACPQHTFMILTKRPERMRKYMMSWTTDRIIRQNNATLPLPNLWLGVTAENQEMADKRIPILLDIPAAVRFVSIEPMLGPVNLNLATPCDRNCNEYNHAECPGTTGLCVMQKQLDLVICGGETGGGARPMHPDWAYGLRDDCKNAGVPFFFKSGGEWSLEPPFPRCAYWHDENGLKWWRVGKSWNEIHYRDMPREFPEVK